MTFKFKNIFKNFIKVLRYTRIYKRLAISFILIIILPNLIIGYFSFTVSSKQIDENTTRKSYETLSNINLLINERIKFYEDMSFQLLTNEKLKDLLRKCKDLNRKNIQSSAQYAECKQEINDILYNSSYRNNTYPEKWLLNIEIITNYDQFIQVSSDGLKRGAQHKNIKDFIKSDMCLKAMDYYGLPVWFDTSKENSSFLMLNNNINLGNYITLLRAIPDPQDEDALGIIVVNVSLDLIMNIYKPNQAFIEDGNLLIIGNKKVMTYFVSNTNSGYIKLDDHIIEKIFFLKTGSMIEDKSGKEYNIIFMKSDSTDWIITAVVERTRLLREVYNIRNLIIGVSVICVLIALILAYVVTLSISSPVNKLKNVMIKVGEGEIETTFNDDSEDEIGILGKMFNIMISRIQNLIKTVYEVQLIKKNEEIKRKEAELDALQMQINPHFIYNTLDMIKWESIGQQNGENRVSQMIVAFSNLLRLGTKKTNRPVQIKEEIEHIYAYIDVVHFKTGKKIEIKLNIEDEKILNCKITKLTFQPIVENAVKHGLKNKNCDGEIIVTISCSGDKLTIEIKDSGIGISREKLIQLNEELTSRNSNRLSIGLSNVNERIKLNFGDEYGLHIESVENSFTSVIINIPIIKDENLES